MLNALKKLFGTKSDRDIKEMLPIVDQINEIYPELSKLSNDELRRKTIEFREKIHEYLSGEENRIRELKEQIEEEDDIENREKLWEEVDKLEKRSYEKSQEILNELLPEAFAVMRETARRFKENETIEVTATDFDKSLAQTHEHIQIKGDKAIYNNSWKAGGTIITWDMIHYDVQLIGGVVLHQGKIAEMATGEGKTVVATLPVYLNALPGKGVHIVTVNDYLAKRDSEWMGVLFEFHGLKVDCIDKHDPNSDARRQAYLADITYGTNNEFGFDYLRDNMTGNPKELVQRPHNYTIVDEVDSVLIDDARTPLIISGPTPKGDKQEFHELKPAVERLYSAQRKFVTNILAEAKSILSKEEPSTEEEKKGRDLLFRAYRGLPKNKALIKFLSEPGIRSLLQKTENFYLQEQSKNMHIIDEQLFFVIDEKNNSIDITEKGIDLITESYQETDFYVLPDIGSEIAELEKHDISEDEKLKKKNVLLQDFAIKSERVHSVNQLLKAYALFEKDVEYVIMDNKIKIVDEQTGRILEGRRYSDGLHQAIEAKENVKVEAATQTYATITLQNYFRMYNKLAGMTGTAETEAGELWDIYELDVVVVPTNKPIVRDDRQDLVYKTKREKFNAVIEEIVELIKAGRPVLVGTTSVETSELLSKLLQRKHIKHNVLNAKLHQKEADVVAEAGIAGAVTIATNMAGRGTDIKLGKGVKEAGGLAIIGTERHESRRVDRQLRGRAGRQGDPGSSQFFVSLEDDLMRMFGSGRIAGIMDRLGLKEGEVIQHSMITKSIERAQKKVEENNFGIRKRLLEYDDVMNSQREVIYKKRRHALFGDRLAVDISNMIFDVAEKTVLDFQEMRDYEGFRMSLLKNLAVDSPFDEQDFMQLSPAEITQKIFSIVYENYSEKRKLIAQKTYPVIRDVYERKTPYENIAIPITDGNKNMQAIANLKKAYEDKGKEVSLAIDKGINLSIIDNSWKEHLREMDDLKQSVQNAQYEQKDPLLIYKFESFELFKKMVEKINEEIVSFLIRADIPMQDADTVQEAQQPRGVDMSRMKEERTDLLSQAHADTQGKRSTEPIKRTERKIGRNEKVTVRYNDGREIQKKYKLIEQDLNRGECQIVNQP
ncbi:MAG: preprotein translocase subunit SecA [Bacteroidales bacterium]|nr:preprotein translocase subunit SecA [Bacteroidales bacterium]MCF8377491.1 preprotein translocase subunit SecA [Bacteroidales bacterium]MCF8401614.1 preprotein translocase subunit SecA [Bacteroidales bacterium]